MERIHKLLFNIDKTYHEGKPAQLSNTFTNVYVQGMGACLQKAIDICLQFQETYPDIELKTETYTVPIEDQILSNVDSDNENPLFESED